MIQYCDTFQVTVLRYWTINHCILKKRLLNNLHYSMVITVSLSLHNTKIHHINFIAPTYVISNIVTQCGFMQLLCAT